MARNETTLRFRGDDSDLIRAFGDVGTKADRMADDIDQAARDASGSLDRLEKEANGGFDRFNTGVEGSVGKFRGFKDTIDGTTDIAEGFRTGDVSMLLGGFADLADGLSSVLLPKLNELTDTLKNKIGEAVGAANTKLATLGTGSTMAALGTFAGALAAILGALEGIDFLLEKILGLPEDAITGPLETVRDFIDDPGGLGMPDWAEGAIDQWKDLLSDLNPFGHTGGLVPGPAGRDVPMILQAGEMIIPRGQTMGGPGIVVNVGGSIISERDLGRVIADQLRNNRLIGVN